MDLHGIEWGVLGTAVLGILGAIGGAVWKAGKWVGKQCFDKDTGLVVAYVKNQKQFLDGLELRETTQQGLCDQHVEVIAKTSGDVVALKSAGLQACQLCRDMMSEEDDSVKCRLAQIEEVLTGDG